MLSTLNEKFKSDKGDHGYLTSYYDEAFRPYQNKKITLLEIGINKGNSLELWAEYFSKDSTIIGIDKQDTGYQPSQKNIIVKIGKAQQPNTFKDFKKLDIIIDDGSHKLHHQLSTFKILYHKLSPQGLYIIEDIQKFDSSKEDFIRLANSFKSKIRMFDLRGSLNAKKDSVLVEIRK